MAVTLVRRRMSRWEFWVGIAYAFIVFVLVGLFYVNKRTSHTLARQEALQQANATRIAAAADATFRACLVSIPQLTRINTFVHGVQDLHVALVENSVANHKATPPGTDVYRQQIVNIKRLERSVAEVSNFRFPVPTARQCQSRRQQVLDGG